MTIGVTNGEHKPYDAKPIYYERGINDFGRQEKAIAEWMSLQNQHYIMIRKSQTSNNRNGGQLSEIISVQFREGNTSMSTTCNSCAQLAHTTVAT